MMRSHDHLSVARHGSGHTIATFTACPGAESVTNVCASAFAPLTNTALAAEAARPSVVASAKQSFGSCWLH